jgi:hypothetical protein
MVGEGTSGPRAVTGWMLLEHRQAKDPTAACLALSVPTHHQSWGLYVVLGSGTWCPWWHIA